MLKRSILFKKKLIYLLRQIIKKRMTKAYFYSCWGFFPLSAMAQPKLSEEARISLMTSAPYDERYSPCTGMPLYAYTIPSKI